MKVEVAVTSISVKSKQKQKSNSVNSSLVLNDSSTIIDELKKK